MTEYVDQSASGLRFYLAARDVDVRPFTLIKETAMVWNKCQIEIGILGASHFCKVTTPEGKCLSEIFACAEIADENSSIRSAPFDDLAAEVRTSFAGTLAYQFVPRLVSWSDGVQELDRLRHLIKQSDHDQRAHGLLHQFPSLPDDDHTKPPLTLVYAKVRGALTLRTAHCYPNEDQIVFTTTTISNTGG